MTFDVFLIMRYIGTSTRILSEKLVFQVQSTAILIETIGRGGDPARTILGGDFYEFCHPLK